MVETTLIKNALIVTGDEKGTIHLDSSLLIEGNRISAIGEISQKADKVIDASGCVVIPGLITAHTHLYGILLRGASLQIEPPTDFAQVLQRVWWPVDEALTITDAEASALSASADMIRNGSTFFADTYSGPNSIEGSLEAIARSTEKVGIRSLLAFEMTERNDPSEAERGLKENIDFAKRCKQSPGITSAMMSLHASFTVEDVLVIKAVEEAKRLGMPITVHTSEGLVDLYHNLERWGERTVERMNRLNLLGPETVLAHCVHINEKEMELIAKSGSSVAHNPMSNMLNAVGTAPVLEMLEKGITVGLGNDGWIFDPFENMRCALTVHRLEHRNPSAIQPGTIFRMATIEGAKCYGLDEQIGSLEVGKLADVVVLEASNVPTPINTDSVIGHLVNTFSGRDVRDVLVDGKFVLRDGKLEHIEESKVTEMSQKSAQSLWDRLD